MTDVKSFQESVKKGDRAAVEAALADDPNLLDAKNDAGQSAFLLAMYYRQREMADYLLSRNPNLDVFEECVAGLSERVMTRVRAHPEMLQAHSGDGWTPLHLAAFFGQTELANVLISDGANVDARSTNAMKNTPLHAAAAGGQVETAKLLLTRGADPNAKQEGGFTALHSAAQAGNRELIELLLANGAHVNVRADNNQAPLDLALTKGHGEVAELLESLGAKF